MNGRNVQHAGSRRHESWWRGPWPPAILIVAGMVLLAWELSWAVPLLGGER